MVFPPILIFHGLSLPYFGKNGKKYFCRFLSFSKQEEYFPHNHADFSKDSNPVTFISRKIFTSFLFSFCRIVFPFVFSKKMPPQKQFCSGLSVFPIWIIRRIFLHSPTLWLLFKIRFAGSLPLLDVFIIYRKAFTVLSIGFWGTHCHRKRFVLW